MTRKVGRLGRNGVPYVALTVSSTGMAVATLLAIFAPGRAFLLLYGVAVAGMFFVWSIILVAHLRFRSSIGEARLAQFSIRLRLTPFSQIAALISLGVIAVSTCYVQGLKYSVPSFVAFLLGITAFYWILRRRHLKQRIGSERSVASPKGNG